MDSFFISVVVEVVVDSHREGASRKGETRNEMKSSVVVIVDEDSGIKISPDCFRERFAGAGIEPSRSDWACQRW